ncbi:MAG TPA: SAM-dependent methyltransferase [Gaiellaceae bacterium]|nr:SAM-dependent methyltransferase [Gaiellaceae bacterium]
MGRQRPRLRRLEDVVAQAHPKVHDPAAAIAAGEIVVDGIVVTNPRSLVRAGASVALRREPPLRGEAKLRAAVAAFAVAVEGRFALDVGAAAGGFTRVLLDHGVRRVYAVDAGHGQLLGSLRQDPRVVAMERTNLGEVTPELVPRSSSSRSTSRTSHSPPRCRSSSGCGSLPPRTRSRS